MARYQIEWLPSDAIQPLDDEDGLDAVEPVLEFNTAEQSAAVEDWTGAIGQLLEELGCGDEPVDEVICEISPAGRWSVAGPGGRRAALVPVPDLGVAVESTDSRGSGEDELGPEVDVDFDEDGPSLMSRILGPRAAARDLAGGPPPPAPSVAGSSLDGLMAVVPAESAAVLLHQPDTAELTFIAARGPRARAVQGMRIPEAAGVAGLVLSSGTTIAIHEQSGGGGHYTQVDESVGYSTRSLLAVPVTHDGQVIGVLELLNVRSGSFEPWHRALATEAASGLGARLGQGVGST